MNPAANLTHAIRCLRSEPDDPALLDRYARGRDQEAFAALVRRYGPLVLGVARRQLGDRHRAEDVFQATFLALARAAAPLARRPVLTNWLFTVALRQARKLRARDARREARERAAPPPALGADPLELITGRELLRAIDDELDRLLDRLRLPVLLCCVQGLSRAGAARRLGWSDGVVKGRLERGRRRLAAGLEVRGLTPSVALLAALGAVAVPAPLLACAAERAADPWSKAVPAAVAALAGTTTPRLFLPAAVLTGGVLIAGLIGWAVAAGSSTPAERPPAAPVAFAPAAPVRSEPPAPAEPLPDGATRRFGTTAFRHPTTIEGFAASADGKSAVVHSGGRINATVRAYDLATGRAKFAIETEPGGRYVEGVALAHDGKTLALKRGHAVHLHDAADGKPVTSVAYPSANPSTTTDLLAFSRDGKHVVVAAADGRALHLLDVVKREVVRTLPHAHVVFAAAFSPDGRHLVGGGYDREKGMYFARVWDVEAGRELRRLPFGNGGIRAVAYSPDGKTVAVGGDGGRPLEVKLFVAATGKELLKFTYPDASSVRSLAFSPNGKTLAASGGSSTRLFDAATGREQLKIARKAIGLRFAPDGASLVGAVAGTIYRWDAATGKALIPEGGDSPVAQVEPTPDGNALITRGQDGDAHVWDARTGEHLRRVDVGWQRGTALSPDGRFLVWSVADAKVQFKDPDEPNAIVTGSRLQMFDLTTGKLVERFGGFEGEAHDLFFSADGKALVTADHRDATVRLWDVATGKVERSFRAGEKVRYQVWHTRLSPDGKVLAVTYQPSGRGIFSERAVKLWDTSSGKERHHLSGHLNYVEVMAFSPDGKHLVTGCEALSAFAQERLKRPADQVFVWDVGTGKRVASLPLGAAAGAFAPDGQALALATTDGTIQFWDPATWKVRAAFTVPQPRVLSLTYGPDGRLYSGSVDATVLAWDSKAEKPVVPK